MSTLDELLGLDPTSPEALRADLLVENDQELLDALVRVRKDRGLSQADVAKILGVKQPTVADFEAHDSNPTLSRIRRYAHAVGALISHRVELDSGQLLDHRRDEWVPASITVKVAASPTRQRPVGVTRSPGVRLGTFRSAEVGHRDHQFTPAA
ncbi:helix-turn-helix transcriptional regulator [Tessaracoccus sp. MC1679]|uniref:helix-turn-helix domain-containing protein n=1 Tax=Tessaracoccus sp. MC1679 TaxID=2760313 RepID=UPI0016049CAC|nr:helix-turn-helix transcriptional regulator [Tessaracoccus sp. MC1679]MBB1516004.1 helix-turn-helix transcriptional regulator [Tessaracoccus sp. MC1679]